MRSSAFLTDSGGLTSISVRSNANLTFFIHFIRDGGLTSINLTYFWISCKDFVDLTSDSANLALAWCLDVS